MRLTIDERYAMKERDRQIVKNGHMLITLRTMYMDAEDGTIEYEFPDTYREEDFAMGAVYGLRKLYEALFTQKEVN